MAPSDGGSHPQIRGHTLIWGGVGGGGSPSDAGGGETPSGRSCRIVSYQQLHMPVHVYMHACVVLVRDAAV